MKLQDIVILIVVVSLTAIAGTTCRNKDLDEYIATYKEFQAAAERSVIFSDSLQQEVDAATAAAQIRIETADSLRRRIIELDRTRPTGASLRSAQTRIDSLKEVIEDSVELARVVIPAQDSLITEQAKTITNFQTANTLLNDEVTNVRAAFDKQKIATVLLQTSNDSLRAIIIKLPPPPPNDKIFGFIPKPSRTATFFAGAIASAVIIGVTGK